MASQLKKFLEKCLCGEVSNDGCERLSGAFVFAESVPCESVSVPCLLSFGQNSIVHSRGVGYSKITGKGFLPCKPHASVQGGIMEARPRR